LSLQEPPVIPVTFLTSESYAKLRGYEGVKSLNVSFSFRTYEGDGLLLYHRFTSDGHIKVFVIIVSVGFLFHSDEMNFLPGEKES
jgi:hypothetical protein